MSNDFYCMVQSKGIVQEHIFYSGNGKGVIKFKIETKNHDGQKEIIDCIAFGGIAKDVYEQIKSGSIVILRGSIKTGRYQKNGNWVQTTELFIEKFKMEG